MKPEYAISILLLAVVVLGGAWLLTQKAPTNAKPATNTMPYIEIVNPSGFVNTDGITIGELVGKKIILVEFLTYSCINCQRTFPHVVSWYSKYRDDGLEIIGIHTPEFAFEKDIDNVRDAMKEFGIEYPIVLDNEYATWNAYGNRYWPRKYLIDIHGNVVYDHIGEGAYEETEMKIQELLRERATTLGLAMPDVERSAASITPEQNTARSPETYFGSLRNEYLANGTPRRSGEQQFSLPHIFSQNALYLGGKWDIAPEYAESIANAEIVYRYTAKEVYIVADSDVATEIEILQDGTSASASAGVDVNQNGVVIVGESRLYKLIRNEVPGEHVLKLKVRGSGVRFYAFTFG